MSKGDDERVQAGIDYGTPIQRANQAAQTQRTNQANDIFYGSPQQQASLGGGGGYPGGGAPGQDYQQQGMPSYYNPNDPVHQAVMQAFQAKGIMPRDAGDFNYWVDHINQSGGLANGYQNSGGTGTWADRMARSSGGVGDYGSGSPGGGGGYNTQGVGGMAGQAIGQQGDIYNRYGQFADTGGFSDEDLRNIRARALSPTKAAYADAQMQMNRQRALQGGYSPGFNVAQARMARQQGQALSDAATGAESNIAQMVQQGKLAGMGGMAGIYGATPGLANMFGQQALQQQQQQLAHQASQQDQTQLQLNKANAGRGGAMRTIGGIAKIGAGVAGAFGA